MYSYQSAHLEEFAEFVINNSVIEKTSKISTKNLLPKAPKIPKTSKTNKPSQSKELKQDQIKQAIYKYFEVSSTPELKKSGEFSLATRDMKLNLGQKESWKVLYREFIGVLPEEDGEKGIDCINGINIFKYFHPWRVFGLDGKTATEEDIKSAYRRLSKIYHPDNQETGNARIFDRINLMYRSISPSAFQ